MTVWFDVEDIFDYFHAGNRRLSGIQRLSLEIYRAALQVGGDSVRLVRHAPAPLFYTEVGWAEIAALIAGGEAVPAPSGPERAALPGTARDLAPGSRARLSARSAVRRLPDDIRKPLVLGVVTQAQALGELGRFGFNLVAHPVSGLARRTAVLLRGGRGEPQAERGGGAPIGAPGDTVLVLGSPWFRHFSPIARWVRDERRMRFGVLVHDLVPIRHPEWAVTGSARIFEDWYADVLPFCDIVFANSRHTAADVEAYMRERRLGRAPRVQALPIGTGFGTPPELPAVRPPELPEPGSYVLFVSTLEARKNHALAVRIWSRLLQEVHEGRRTAASVPDLVFAGRAGWLVGDLMQQLENTDWLGGKVRMLNSPSDAGLRALYEGCLFTLFPSYHEGWGLPVTESLAFGKPCLTSNAAALPEAGGALCRYFDPEDQDDAFGAVAAVLDDLPGLAAWEQRVRAEFRPTPWTDTAQRLLQAVAQL